MKRSFYEMSKCSKISLGYSQNVSRKSFLLLALKSKFFHFLQLNWKAEISDFEKKVSINFWLDFFSSLIFKKSAQNPTLASKKFQSSIIAPIENIFCVGKRIMFQNPTIVMWKLG